jgi:hypothetical protein
MTAGKYRVRLALEQLEDRCTPSAMGLGLANQFPAQPGGPTAEAAAQVGAADGHAIPIKGEFQCTVDLSTGTVSSIGFGTGGVGHWTAVGHMDHLVIDLAGDRGVYSGTGTLTTAQGEQIFYNFTTSWQLSTGKGTHLITITGGTGRFAGVSGSSVSDCIITADPTSSSIYHCQTQGSGILNFPPPH